MPPIESLYHDIVFPTVVVALIVKLPAVHLLKLLVDVAAATLLMIVTVAPVLLGEIQPVTVSRP